MSLDREIARVERAARGAASEAIEDAFARHDREWAEESRRGTPLRDLRTASYFEILGISPTTDASIIAKAYAERRRAVSGDALALVEEAHKVLSIPSVCRGYYENCRLPDPRGMPTI